MGKALKTVAIMWGVILVVYLLLAFLYPVITGLADEGAAELQATSNMSNYPGTVAVIQAIGLWIWFVPGGLGFIASVVIIRTGTSTG